MLYTLEDKGTIVATISDNDKEEFLNIAKKLYELGYKIVATEGTREALNKENIDAELVEKVNSKENNILDVIRNKNVTLVVNTPTKGNDSERDGFKIRRARIEKNIGVITSLDTLNALVDVKMSGVEKEEARVYAI